MDDARVAFDRFARTEFKRSLADAKVMLPPGTDVPTLSELRTQIMDASPTDWNRLFVRMSPMHMFYARPDWTPRLWEQWDLIASGMRAAYAKDSGVRKTVALIRTGTMSPTDAIDALEAYVPMPGIGAGGKRQHPDLAGKPSDIVATRLTAGEHALHRIMAREGWSQEQVDEWDQVCLEAQRESGMPEYTRMLILLADEGHPPGKCIDLMRTLGQRGVLATPDSGFRTSADPRSASRSSSPLADDGDIEWTQDSIQSSTPPRRQPTPASSRELQMASPVRSPAAVTPTPARSKSQTPLVPDASRKRPVSYDDDARDDTWTGLDVDTPIPATKPTLVWERSPGHESTVDYNRPTPTPSTVHDEDEDEEGSRALIPVPTQRTPPTPAWMKYVTQVSPGGVDLRTPSPASSPSPSPLVTGIRPPRSVGIYAAPHPDPRTPIDPDVEVIRTPVPRASADPDADVIHATPPPGRLPTASTDPGDDVIEATPPRPSRESSSPRTVSAGVMRQHRLVLAPETPPPVARKSRDDGDDVDATRPAMATSGRAGPSTQAGEVTLGMISEYLRDAPGHLAGIVLAGTEVFECGTGQLVTLTADLYCVMVLANREWPIRVADDELLCVVLEGCAATPSGLSPYNVVRVPYWAWRPSRGGRRADKFWP